MIRTMLVVAMVAALVAEAHTALAQSRPDTRAMTCEDAHDLVFDQGAVVMSTGEFTYQRFVRTRRYCAREEVSRVGKAQTRDDPNCVIGYVCVPRLRNDN